MVITPDDFGPNMTPRINPYPRQYIPDYILLASGDRKMCHQGSGLVTAQFLTVCLVAAVSQNDPGLTQKLIEKGASTADKTGLIRAIGRGSDLVPPLFNGANQPRNVVTWGLRTNMPKEAIMQGPRGLMGGNREATNFPQFSYDIAKLTLDHGCEPDGIVNFDETFRPPQPTKWSWSSF
ncbi:hypothetical protein F5X98DRAFT_374779 [Xylaria grammica]|nr:hypothetical protein F5X98DRAFT_374779 [Xylaria grammica]